MATKKANAARQLETYKKLYKRECEKLRWYYLAAAAVTVVALLLFFVKFMYIYNVGTSSTTGEKIGTEISVSGWSLFIATLSAQFESASEIFGDLYLFYYHDGGIMIALGVFTVLSVLCAIACIVLNVIAIFGKQKLTGAALGVDIAAFAMLLITMITALAANGSNILPGYCSSNPNCSIRTLSFLPLILSLAAMVTGILSAVKYSRAEKISRKIKSTERAIEKAKAKAAAEKTEKAAN